MLPTSAKLTCKMREKINQEQRAFYAWTVLIEYAKNNKTITYGELAKQINVHHIAIGFILGVIQDFCMENGLPPLTILILNKETQLPGGGFIAYDIENSQDGINKVYKYNWEKLKNPFEYAKTGNPESKLIEDLIEDPDNSEDTFTKIKVRGIAQKIFRKVLLEVYNNNCAICGLSFSEALEASHIIPYSEANSKQRLDVRNGLLLCSTHHKLFDNNYLTINQDYTISYSESLDNIDEYSEFDKLLTINFIGKKIKVPKLEKHKPDKKYLKQHQKDK